LNPLPWFRIASEHPVYHLRDPAAAALLRKPRDYDPDNDTSPQHQNEAAAKIYSITKITAREGKSTR
jgi:hypothetical protein